MSEGFAVFILMSNYFHDVATAMILACGISMWIMVKQYERSDNEGAGRYFLSIYRNMSKLLAVSIIWIIAGLILRLATWKSFEWKNASMAGHQQGLVAKYVVALIIIVAGIYVWRAVNKKVKRLIKE